MGGLEQGCAEAWARPCSHRLRARSCVPWLRGANAADLHVLKDLVEAGEIIRIVDRTYSLGESAAAIRYRQSEHAVRKVVIID